MENMDNPTMACMAKKFSKMRFRRNKAYKLKGQTTKFKRGYTSNTGVSVTKGGYKTGLVDRLKFRCYNYKEL